MTGHICILSGQTLQNILPLHSHIADYIFLAISEEKQDSAASFIRILVDLGLVANEEKIIILETIPSTDFQQMKDWAVQQLKMIRKILPHGQLTLNATGGNKLMSIALIQACEQPEFAPVEVIYCDTAQQKLETIYPEVFTQPLQDNILTAENILKANGLQVNSALSDQKKWRDTVLNRKDITCLLGQNMAGNLGSFIQTLNYKLSTALEGRKLENAPLPISISFNITSQAWLDALQQLQNSGLISCQNSLQLQRPVTFTINTLENFRYLHGIWLEEYLWLCLDDAGINDIACSVAISNLHEDIAFKHNELDIVIGSRNRLVVVECKTANISRQQVMNLALDKLDGLGRRGGGLLAQRWFVMARWPHKDEDNDLAERFRQQAKDREVVLIEPKHLSNLTQRLKEWKKTGSFPLEEVE
ncbi:DUF1887 family CARF protein [Pseudomonas sp. F1_0610]|uniref:Card1-like endonuclease domain-containing protein n=1 Tax=Pseudomonas sp. F1_0610 TaxID=3114284 RepID=UPI0039C3A004